MNQVQSSLSNKKNYTQEEVVYFNEIVSSVAKSPFAWYLISYIAELEIGVTWC